MEIIKFSNGVMVNLKNISTIKVMQNEKPRIILNMNYCIVKHGNTIPDYVYIDNFTEDDLKSITTNKYIRERFVSATENVLVNKDSIGSLKVENDKVILNLTHPHTYNLTKKNNVSTKTVMAEYINADLSIINCL